MLMPSLQTNDSVYFFSSQSFLWRIATYLIQLFKS